MKLKLIKTKKDYQQALDRLELIFDAKKGTPKGEFNPIKDGYYDHPVDALRYWLVPLMLHLDKKGYDRQNRPNPYNYNNGEVLLMDGKEVVNAVPARRRPSHGYRGNGKSFFGKSGMR